MLIKILTPEILFHRSLSDVINELNILLSELKLSGFTNIETKFTDDGDILIFGDIDTKKSSSVIDRFKNLF